MPRNRTDRKAPYAVPVVDLFAGAGGSAVGAAMAGADVRLSVELDELACQTLIQNRALPGGEILQADVSDLTGPELRRRANIGGNDPLVVIGGPPCQPFSKAAYWTDPGVDSRFRRDRAKGLQSKKPEPILVPREDARRDLLYHFARLIIGSKAHAFMFENVPSIHHPRNRSTFQTFRAKLERAGYRTTLIDANAAQFGVAQTRRRVVMLGVKGGASLDAPPPTHGDRAAPFRTAGSALCPFSDAAYSEPEEVVDGRWSKQLLEVPAGMNYKALTAWAGHPAPVFEAETRFWTFLLKLHPNRPSWTIAANPGPWVGPFHWENRRLRTTELAALQSFPSGYQFVGNRRNRVRQIGNAMPPLLASAMIRPILASTAASFGL